MQTFKQWSVLVVLIAVLAGLTFHSGQKNVKELNTEYDFDNKQVLMDIAHQNLHSAIVFEQNNGQVEEADFIVRGYGKTGFIKNTSLYHPVENDNRINYLEFIPRNTQATDKPQGLNEMAASRNYFRGSSVAIKNIPNFQKLLYQGIYHNIDLVYYGKDNLLEHDYIVYPGGDYQNIQVEVKQAERLSIDAEGALNIHTGESVVRQTIPAIYQLKDGLRQAVGGAFNLIGKNIYGFTLSQFDSSLPVYIDPALEFSTYIGGSSGNSPGDEWVADITTDSAGNIYVIGQTNAVNFPTLNQLEFNGVSTANTNGADTDIFVAKYSSTGERLFTSLIGGTGDDIGRRIQHMNGSLYLVGSSDSPNFPTLNAHQDYSGSLRDGVVFKLDENGSNLDFSTYYGAVNQFNDIFDLVMDEFENLYIVGDGDNIPIITGAFEERLGKGYVAKFNSSGQPVYHSLIPGGKMIGIDLIATDQVCMVGFATQNIGNVSEFPVSVNAFQAIADSADDNAILCIDLSQAGRTGFISGTYFGNPSNTEDSVTDIRVQENGPIVVTGFTTRSDYPVTSDAMEPVGDNISGVLSKFSQDLTAMEYSTFIGAGQLTELYGLDLDSVGNVYLVGAFRSGEFISKGMITPLGEGVAPNGTSRKIFIKLSPDNQIVYSNSSGIAGANGKIYEAHVDEHGVLYVGGDGEADSFPLVNASQNVYGGGSDDGFFAKIVPHMNLVSPLTEAQESAGRIEYKVEYIGGSPTPTFVDYSIINISTSNDDYDLVGTGTLEFAVGETEKSIFVDIVDDSLDDDDEEYKVILSNPVDGAILVDPFEVTTKIIDNDLPPVPGVFNFEGTGTQVGETDGTVTFSVLRSDGTDLPSSVEVVISGGTASAGSEYTDIGIVTLNWGDGEGGVRSFTLDVFDDAVEEMDETVIFTLQNAVSASIGTNNTHTLDILDNDAPPKPGVLNFQSSGSSVSEGVGTVTIQVAREQAAEGDASVEVVITGGTADAGSDYTDIGTVTLNWGDGELETKSFDIQITNDTQDENNETILISLQNPTNATLGSTTSYSLTINDNDTAPSTGGGSSGGSGGGSVSYWFILLLTILWSAKFIRTMGNSRRR